MQRIWEHQRLRRDQLATTTGLPVRVLHPGFRSVEGGPDFRSAVIKVGDRPPRSGDVEVDLRPAGWRAHHHDTNIAFKGVILHVVWEGAPAGPGESHAPPRMVIKHSLDASLGELHRWLGGGAASLPDALLGKCCAPLRELPREGVLELLRQAALVRLRAKASIFDARARQAGWAQALWEGLFRALGYKHNIWPMQRVAELREIWQDAPDLLTAQARVLGISGLLPVELARGAPGNDQYLRSVWDCWWRERDAFAEYVLPAAAWRLYGVRPINHPHRRLAVGASWIWRGDLVQRLEQWAAAAHAARDIVPSLLRELQPETDPFWSWHYTFKSARTRVAQPLLGSARVVDLAMNVVFPWLLAHNGPERDSLAATIEQMYLDCPAAQDNTVLRLARQRLLGADRLSWLKTAAAQQGLIQIVRDFCEHSNSLCEGCRMPDLVRDFVRGELNTPIARDNPVVTGAAS